jgi:hypothetical protein
MNIYQQLEDALFTAFSSQFPTERITFPFANAPEPQTPYVILDIMRLDAQGREQNSGLTSAGVATILQTYEATVRIEVIGEYDNQTVIGDLSHKIEFSLRTPLFQNALLEQSLSLMRAGRVERFPRKRDTKTYMCYQQEVYFAYAVTETQDVGYINSVNIEGVYNDAGRDGHVIVNEIIITP